MSKERLLSDLQCLFMEIQDLHEYNPEVFDAYRDEINFYIQEILILLEE